MRQFEVPQYVDIEGKILGPLTLRQTIIVAISAGIVFLLQFVLEPYLLIPVGIAIGLVTLALTFVKINGMPLLQFIGAFLQYMLFPRLYVWKKKGVARESEIYTKKKSPDDKDAETSEPDIRAMEDRLRSYAQQQDSST